MNNNNNINSGRIEKIIVNKPPPAPSPASFVSASVAGASSSSLLSSSNGGHKLFDPKSNFANVVKIDKKFATRSLSRGARGVGEGGHDSDTGVVLLLTRENSAASGFLSPRKSSLDVTIFTQPSNEAVTSRNQEEQEEANMNKLKSLLNRRLSLNTDRRFGSKLKNDAKQFIISVGNSSNGVGVQDSETVNANDAVNDNQTQLNSNNRMPGSCLLFLINRKWEEDFFSVV